MNKVSCLVTGGAGFIGSNLVLELERQGCDVVIADNLLTGRKENLKMSKGQFLELDVSRPFKINKKFDIIIHEAAITDPRYENDDEMFRANLEGFGNIIDLAKVNNAKLVYASTANLYGNGPVPMNESQKKEIISSYGKVKLEMDFLSEKLKDKMHIVGLRYFNVFGPNEQNKGRSASMVSHLLRQMTKDVKPRIFRFGEQKRDHIYVKDAVAATIKALEAPSGIYNVGTGTATSFNELVNILNEILDKQLEPEYIDMPFNSSTYQNHTVADTTLAEKKLKWKASYQLKDGIKETIAWFEKFN